MLAITFMVILFWLLLLKYQKVDANILIASIRRDIDALVLLLLIWWFSDAVYSIYLENAFPHTSKFCLLNKNAHAYCCYKCSVWWALFLDIDIIEIICILYIFAIYSIIFRMIASFMLLLLLNNTPLLQQNYLLRHTCKRYYFMKTLPEIFSFHL